MNIAILGSANGDESKGSFTHYFSPNYSWVVRFGGGNNCGHTIYTNGKKYVHHLVPSIDFHNSQAKGFLGSGMVIDLQGLLNELMALEVDFPGVSHRIFVDPDAFIVSEYHKELDKQNNGHIGTTNRGIGPAYADKIMRKGVRIRDLLNASPGGLGNNSHLSALQLLGVNFKHMLELENEFKEAKILFEGAQGILLDINHGIYPYVSCSDCTVAGIYANGFNFIKLNQVYGVAKVYNTKVGAGPFPTEIFGEEAQAIRERGNEFGSTTNRPRRIGWLDLPALRYAIKKGGITSLIMTKFDILAGMKAVPVCTAYEKEPMCGADFTSTGELRYTNIRGWLECINPITTHPNVNLRDFIAFIEGEAKCHIDYISHGTKPSDILQLSGIR